jgi:hypothetical protein
MAVGDVFDGSATLTAGASVDIRPSAGVEAVIHNIYHDGDVELIKTDGTVSVSFDSDVGKGVYAKFSIHVTNSRWLQVKNISAGTVKVSWDGIVTKG